MIDLADCEEPWRDDEDYDEWWGHPEVVAIHKEFCRLLEEGKYRDLPAHWMKYSGHTITLSSGNTYNFYRLGITQQEAELLAIQFLYDRLDRLTKFLRNMQNTARKHSVEDMGHYERHWFFRKKARAHSWPKLQDYDYQAGEHRVFDYPLHLLNINRLKINAQ